MTISSTPIKNLFLNSAITNTESLNTEINTINTEINTINTEITNINKKIQRHEYSILDIYDALRYLSIWIVRTPDDLIALKKHYNESHPSENERIFALQVADIDMTGIPWEGIGIDGYPFRGTYNGNYYKITGLKFDATSFTNEANNYLALFRYAECADIKNLELTVDGFELPAGYSISHTYKTLAELNAAEEAKVENVFYVLDTENIENRNANGKKFVYYWTGSKFDTFEFGGAAVVGKAGKNLSIDPSTRVWIENVTVNGNIGSKDMPCSHNAAGFVVKTNGITKTDGSEEDKKEFALNNLQMIFVNCTNNVNVYCAYTKCGGFVAYNENASGKFTNCVNNGTIWNPLAKNAANNGGVGGFIGWTSTSLGAYAYVFMENCKNLGSIESEFINKESDDYEYAYASDQITTAFGRIVMTSCFALNDHAAFSTPSGTTNKYILGKCNDDTNEVELMITNDNTVYNGEHYVFMHKFDERSTYTYVDPTTKAKTCCQSKPNMQVTGSGSFYLDESLCDIASGYEVAVSHKSGKPVTKTKISDTVYKFEW